MTHDDGKLIAKTDNEREHNLDKITYQAFSSWADKGRDHDPEFTKFQFNLFTDKNIDEFKIDSIKNLLKSGPFKRIFRVYTNEKINYEKTDWKDKIKWLGVYE